LTDSTVISCARPIASEKVDSTGGAFLESDKLQKPKYRDQDIVGNIAPFERGDLSMPSPLRLLGLFLLVACTKGGLVPPPAGGERPQAAASDDVPPTGKLPPDVRPTRYALSLEIDPAKIVGRRSPSSRIGPAPSSGCTARICTSRPPRSTGSRRRIRRSIRTAWRSSGFPGP
jgi:hypothetical protein